MPLDEYVPLYSSDKGVATQFNMTTIEELGLLKMDFIGLRNLTVIRDALKMIKENHGVDIDFSSMDYDDPEVYKLIAEGNTAGVFQLESGGMYAESGGHYCDPLFAFLLTYNAIKGNESYLKPAGEFGKNLLFPYLYVASPDDYANYDKYFVQDTPYTDEELTAMGEMDYADLEAACSALSIEDVMARHGAGAAETEAE
jgi:hypothetical protein